MLQSLNFILRLSIANSFLFALVGTRYLYYLLQSNTLFYANGITYEGIIGKSFVLSFTFSAFLGHFTLLAFLVGALAVPFVLFKKKSIVLFTSILLNAIVLILLVIDSIIFSQYRFHLNWSIVNLFLTQNLSFVTFFTFSKLEIYLGFVLISLIFLIETSLAYFSWKYLFKKMGNIIAIILGITSISLMLSYSLLSYTLRQGNNIFAYQTPYFPLYTQTIASLWKNGTAINLLSETHFSQPRLPSVSLRYPLQKIICTPEKKPFNLLIIGIDSWRFDSITLQRMPHLLSFSNQGWTFKDHWSGGNATQPGIFSLFYSLPGTYWQSIVDQKKSPVFIDELLKQHYQPAIFFSSGLLPFNKNVFLNISLLDKHEANGITTPDKDRHITNEFIQFLKQYDGEHPFFGFLFYTSSHDYCSEQNIHNVFPAKSMCNRLLPNEAAMQNTRYRYWNAVHFIDQEIAKILAALNELNLNKNTIVLITGDHGEELGDNQSFYWGHAGNYTHYQVQTPLIISWPKEKASIWQHRTSHYDIIPTLMKHVLKCENNIIDYGLGKDLLDQTNRQYIIASSYINTGIIEKNRHTTLYSSGDISITRENSNEIPTDSPNLSVLKKVLLDMHFYDANHTPH